MKDQRISNPDNPIATGQWQVLKERVGWHGTEKEFVELLEKRIREIKHESN